MKDLLLISLPFAAAILIAVFTTGLWIKASLLWHLFDKPDARKHHFEATPSMGGIGIFSSLVITFLLFCGFHDFTQLHAVLAASCILFFTGFFDDLLNLAPFKKFIMQVLAAFIVCYNGVVISNLHGFLGIYQLPEGYAVAFTMLVIVFFVNAFNFIDGIDGLAGSLGAVSSFIFAIMAFRLGQGDLALLSFCLTGSLLGFLFWNKHPARIFMGDTGSLTVGFLLIIQGIMILNLNPVVNEWNESASMTFVFSVLFIPAYDLIRVVVIRIVSGDSPMKPDRNHLHHMIGRQNFGHNGICFIILVFNLSLILFQEQFRFIHINYFIIISILMTMLTLNSYFIRRVAYLRDKITGRSTAWSGISES
jgi:UDP-N-acetylmuramyl pentapeptide phosphotransferase/UDP-N-acetylglucosamine-1-phosphate transferase